VLNFLNQRCDPGDRHHIVRMRDYFLHANHLCLAFELLSLNLYELVKHNQFRGLSMNLLRVFLLQARARPAAAAPAWGCLPVTAPAQLQHPPPGRSPAAHGERGWRARSPAAGLQAAVRGARPRAAAALRGGLGLQQARTHTRLKWHRPHH